MPFINQRYEIIRDLGAGGWSKVYLANDLEAKKHVAIKEVPLNTEVAVKIADMEIQTLSRLEHPYVVKLLDTFKNDTSFYIVTEYVGGSCLEDLIDRRAVDPAAAGKYGLQTIEALDYIHSQGIIHSDLKPANIIVDSQGNVRLIDFGIVRTASAEIAADIKEVRGTLHYLSPEQAEGRPYDIRSDLFSFGVLLYEMYTGRKPFAGDYDMAVMYSILYENPIPPDKIDSRISVSLSAVIEKLLAKNPDERPSSAAQVREMLTGVLDEPGQSSDELGNRIAVLTLRFPEGDHRSRLIAEGLRDEIYSRLKKIPDIDVVSPVKVNQHATELADGSAVRALLGADHYLTGSIRMAEDRIRIYVTLFASRDDSDVWAYRYDNPMSDLFDIVDLITENVMDGLQIRLIRHGRQSKAARPTNLPEAYELYLLGRNYYVKNTRGDIEYARSMYLEALKLDPVYALAMVGLADCYCLEYMNYFDRATETIETARRYAQAALKVCSNLPEAYRALGRIMQAVGNLKDAALYYLKAVTYKDDYHQAYRCLGWLSKECLKYDEALQWVRKALSINSTDLETIFLKGIINYEKKDSTAAVNDLTRCLELRPDYGRAHFYLGMTNFQMGRVIQAVAAMEKAVELGGDINAPYLLGYYHIAQSEFAEAVSILQSAATRHEIAFIAHYYLGLVLVLQNDEPAGREHFGRAIALCDKLIADDPDFILAKAVKATALAFLGRKDQCLDLIREVLPYSIQDGSLAHDVARIHAVLGDEKRAKEFVRKAIETPQGPSGAEIALDPILQRFLGSEGMG